MSYMEFYKGKKILITGGTGSIGSTIARELVNDGNQICILSRDESKQSDLRTEIGGIHFIIGDVRDMGTVQKAVRGMDIVIHAAAMKHVDKCNEFPAEAIKTNLLGAMNVQSASIQARVQTCVAISTDKASMPKGVMGLTKRLQEYLFLNEYVGITETKIVRFGNVMGSRGSVAQIFRQQLADNKDLTVTNPDMFRFFMTPNDAAELVLWAGAYAPDKSISTRVMKSATVRDLVYALGVPEHRMTIIGQKDGEKITEQLLDDEELYRTTIYSTQGGGIAVVRNGQSDMTGDISKLKDRLSLSSNHMSIERLQQMLRETGILS